jgi:hypothetical protein
VLREPRRELVKLFDAERASLARSVTDRRDAQDGLIDSLATPASVAEDTFQVL